MFKNGWSDPPRQNGQREAGIGSAAAALSPAVSRSGGRSRRRVLATLAIVSLLGANVGLSTLNAQGAHALGLTEAKPTSVVPGIAGKEAFRWEGRLESYSGTGGNYNWLTSSTTSSTYGPTLPASYGGPTFTGPMVGEPGPIIDIATQNCLEGTAVVAPGRPSATKVLLATCDPNSLAQQWVSARNITTIKGTQLGFKTMDSAVPGNLIVATYGGLFLDVSGVTTVGILDPVEQTADLVFTSPTDNEVVAVSGTVVVSGTGKPGATVTVRDENNTVRGTTVTVAGDTTWSIGSQTFTAGTHTLTGAMSSGKNASVTFDVGERIASAEHSTIVAAPTSVTADGLTVSTVTVTARDANGVALTKGGATVELSSSLGTLSEVTDNLDGTYSATLSSTTAGTASVGFEFNGTTSTLFAEVTFTAGSLVIGAENGTHYNVSEGDAVVGVDSHTITVQTADAYGNAVVLDDPARITATYAPLANPVDRVKISPFTATGTPGTYTASVTSEVIGAKNIAVKIDATSVAVNPDMTNTAATFIAGAVDLTHGDSGYSVTENGQSVDDGAHAVTVVLTDEFGNPVALSDLAELKGTSSPSNNVTVGAFEALAGTPGSYVASVTSTVAGPKTISVWLGDTEIPASGNTVALFTSGGVSISQDGTNYAVSEGDETVGSGAHTITIRMVDAHNNPVENLTRSAFVLTAAPGEGVTFGDDFAESESDPGTYTISVSSIVAGSETIQVSYGANPLNAAEEGTANIIAEFIAGSASVTDATLTNFTVSGDDVVVGDNGHTITVKVADSFGNPISDIAAELTAAAADLGTGTVTGFAETGTAGTYVATVTSSLIGSKIVSVLLGTDEISVLPTGGNAQAMFIAGAVSATTSTISIDTATVHANGEAASTATVVLKDAFGNLITSVADGTVVAIETSLGTATATVPGATAGTFTSEISSTVGGDADVTFTVNSSPAATAPATVTFVSVAAPAVTYANGSVVVGTGIKGDTIIVRNEDGDELGRAIVADDGSFAVAISGVITGDVLNVVAVDTNNFESDPATVTVDADIPGKPVVNPSNGDEVSGNTKPGSSVVVKDKDGNVLCETTADVNGDFSCVPSPKPVDGDKVIVEVTDPSGNESEPGEVVIDTVAPDAPVVNPSNGSQISGTGEAGAKVTVKDSEGIILCETTVTEKGQFMCVPMPKPGHGTEISVTLTDPSGNVSEPGTIVINAVGPTAPIVDVSNGKTITGGVIDDGNIVTVVDGNGNEVPGVTVVDSAGRFTFTPTTPLSEGDVVRVVVTDPAGNSTAVPVRIKTTKPAKPVVNPVEGGTVTGCAEPGSTVNIYDEDGNLLGQTTAGDDCKFIVELKPAPKDGTIIVVDVTDQAGNTSESVSIRVGLISVVLEHQQLTLGASQTAYGYGFQAGETVTAVLHSTPVELGTAVADADGNVTFSFTLPSALELGEHTVTLTGDFSGSAQASFEVVASEAKLVVTGSEVLLPATGALLLLVAGLGLVLAKRHRREAEHAQNLL